MNVRLHHRVAALIIAATVGISTSPRRAEANSPDPVIAALISTGTTIIPLSATAALWTGDRGTGEGVRFDLGMMFLALGAIIGPSVGQIYAEGGADAWTVFILRAITASIGIAGAGLWARGSNFDVRNAGRALSAVGGVPTLLLAVYDIWDAADNAVDTQRRRGYSPRSGLHGVDASPPALIVVSPIDVTPPLRTARSRPQAEPALLWQAPSATLRLLAVPAVQWQ